MACKKLHTTHNNIISSIYFQEFSDIESLCPLFIKQNLYSDFVVTPIFRKDIKKMQRYNIVEIVLYYWNNGDSPLFAASKLKDMRIFDELLLYITPRNYLNCHFEPIISRLISKGDYRRSNMLKTELLKVNKI